MGKILPLVIFETDLDGISSWNTIGAADVLEIDWQELTPDWNPPDTMFDAWLTNVDTAVGLIGSETRADLDERRRWLDRLADHFENMEPTDFHNDDHRLHWQATVEKIHDTLAMVKVHVHTWGPVEQGNGEPHRKCTGWVDETHICGAVSLDLDEEVDA